MNDQQPTIAPRSVGRPKKKDEEKRRQQLEQLINLEPIQSEPIQSEPIQSEQVIPKRPVGRPKKEPTQSEQVIPKRPRGRPAGSKKFTEEEQRAKKTEYFKKYNYNMRLLAEKQRILQERALQNK